MYSILRTVPCVLSELIKLTQRGLVLKLPSVWCYSPVRVLAAIPLWLQSYCTSSGSNPQLPLSWYRSNNVADLQGPFYLGQGCLLGHDDELHNKNLHLYILNKPESPFTSLHCYLLWQAYKCTYLKFIFFTWVHMCEFLCLRAGGLEKWKYGRQTRSLIPMSTLPPLTSSLFATRRSALSLTQQTPQLFCFFTVKVLTNHERYLEGGPLIRVWLSHEICHTCVLGACLRRPRQRTWWRAFDSERKLMLGQTAWHTGILKDWFFFFYRCEQDFGSSVVLIQTCESDTN